MGLAPPFSGYFNNLNRNSNGCYIRSEIWACLAPGHPEIAVKYAYEDGICDHSDEGLYGEIFSAAIQSAAFVETDIKKLIEIGLSYIPEESDMAKAICTVLDCYNSGVEWKECYRKLLFDFPSTFGTLCNIYYGCEKDEFPTGQAGYDAPCNVGLTVLGLMYGEGDFGRAICLASSCAEDSDCTAATIGALYGIMFGTKGIEPKWIEPIGDKIITLSINLADHDCDIPKTVTELTNRILRQTPLFLGPQWCDCLIEDAGYAIKTLDKGELHNTNVRRGAFDFDNFFDILSCQPFAARVQTTLFDAVLDYKGIPTIEPNGEKTFELRLQNQFLSQQFVNVRWYLPEGFAVSPSAYSCLPLEQYHGGIGRAHASYTLRAPEILTQPKYELLLELSVNGRHSKGYIPVTLINGPENPIPESSFNPKP